MRPVEVPVRVESNFTARGRLTGLCHTQVGALLALKSHVVHVCDQGRVCVDVTAAVWKPGLRESTLTNNFSFVFDASKAPRPLKDVLPVVRTEAAMQLDAIERMQNCD